MASRYEVEVAISSARDLKNVNWRNGDLKPYAVLWIDDGPKCSTKAASSSYGGSSNSNVVVFDDKIAVPVPPSSVRIEDSTLYVDIVHARSDSDVAEVKPLVGSAKIPLREVVEEVGIGGGKMEKTLKLKRPSGRPQGKVEVKIAVKEPRRYYDPYASGPVPYGQSTRGGGGGGDYPYGGQPAYGGYVGQPPYGGGYGQPAPYGGGYGAPPAAAAPPAGYPYGGPPAPGAYGGGGSAYSGGMGVPAYSGYGSYGGGQVEEVKKKKSGMGMGTGLAVGAVAGVLGGLALAEGVDYVEDKIEDNVAERVEDDLAYEDGGYDDF